MWLQSKGDRLTVLEPISRTPRGVWDNKYKLENRKLMWFVNLSFLISNQKCVINKPGMVFKVWLFTSFIFIRIANTTLSISNSVFS